MNKQLASLLVTLLIVPFGAVSAATDSDKVTEPQVTPTDLQPAPAANNDNKAPEKAEIENAEAVDTAADKAVDKAVEPITGAFGIPLGEHFEASMVAKVLSKQEHSYKGQGTTKLKGQLLRIEPVKPDDRFQQYSLKTTDEGIIYAIQGDYQYKAESDKAMPDEANQDEARPDEAMQVEAMQVEAKAKGSGKGAGKPGNRQPANAMQLTCKAAVNTLAGELEARYGKPRGQGWDGLWYTFRQFSDTANKGVKLYGHRCRTGMYSIIYTDNKAQRAMQPGKAKSSVEAGTPATGSAPKQP